jgi:flagellar basal-body rod modification protein FlgD
MEVNGNYSSIPVVAEESVFADNSKDADQLRVDFLKMLTAQLEYQDPMDPVENTEFTAQMAQFSSLGEQQKGNELLQQLISAQSTNQLNQVVSYIGNQVVFDGDKTTAANGKATARFKMEEAGVAEVKLYDQNGQFVRSATGSFSKGDQSFQFDDEALADGNYSFTVSAQGSGGGAIKAKTYESGQVTGVVNGESGVQLEVNGHTLSLADVYRVEQQTG